MVALMLLVEGKIDRISLNNNLTVFCEAEEAGSL